MTDTNPSGVSEAVQNHASEREAAIESLLGRWNPQNADKPKPAGKPEEKAEAKPETEAAAEEPDDKSEATEAKPDDEAPAGADKAEAKDDDKGEEIAIELDGEKLTPKQIREWKKGQMLQADYTRKTQSLAEQRKAVEAKAQEIETTKAQQLAHLNILGNTLVQQLTHIEQNTNWDELRQKDPAAFVAAREAIAQRQNTLRQVLNAAQQVEAQKQQETQAAKQKRLAQEAELLPTRIPEWVDEKTAERERGELASYLEKDGFTKEDESLLENHKAIALFRKAMLYDAQKAAMAKAKEKAEKPVPKFTKPGAQSAAPDKKQKAMETLRIRGDRDSAVEALLARQRG